jgi:lysozyme
MPYKDTTGHVTIGVGRNLTDKGISQDEALTMLHNDIAEVTKHLSSTYYWFDGLNTMRKHAIIDMCFNLGPRGFSKFERLVSALHRNDFHTASLEMMDSRWATQVGNRATLLSSMVLYG